eukprot:5731754-Pyramimonas_sp.AAC.1
MNRAQSRAVASSLADFKQWVPDHDGTGALFKATRDAPLPTLELDSTDGMIYQPMDVIDKKAQHWHKLWTSSQDISMDTVSATFRRIKEATFPGDFPEITTSDIRGALRRMKPRAGQGLDRLSPTDLDRLPDAALAALASLFVMTEESCTWPWQLLPVLGRPLPKKSSGDRIIGL